MGRTLCRRVVEPELLDSLPVDDAQAIASRHDLVRVNAVMFQSAIMARQLGANLEDKPLRLLELGAGDGRFSLSVARRLARRWQNVDLVMLDRADVVKVEVKLALAALGWRVQTDVVDIFDWIQRPDTGRFDAISANLFLHHFTDRQLRLLLAAMARRTAVFVATEPRRNTFALWSSAWLRVLGANAVTLHDAAASVRAGFADKELSRLWPPDTEMTLQEQSLGPFSHVFVARAAVR